MPKTYEPIATRTLDSASATVTFSSIAATYTDLVIVVNAAVTAGLVNLYVNFNNDIATNYSYTYLDGDGTAASSNRSSNNTKITANNYGFMTTTFGSNYLINVMNYANTTTNKTMISRSNAAANGVSAVVGLWRSTAAINRVDLTTSASTFIAGSTFTLYGIKAA